MSLLCKLTGCFGNTPQNTLLIFDASLAHIPVWYRSLRQNPFAFDWKCTDWHTSHTDVAGLREWLGCTFERPGKMQSHRSVTPHFQKSPACCNKAYVLQILSDCLFTDHYVILLVVFINKNALTDDFFHKAVFVKAFTFYTNLTCGGRGYRLIMDAVSVRLYLAPEAIYSILSNKFDKRCFVSFPDNHQCVTIWAFHGKTSVRLLFGCHIIETVNIRLIDVRKTYHLHPKMLGNCKHRDKNMFWGCCSEGIVKNQRAS